MKTPCRYDSDVWWCRSWQMKFILPLLDGSFQRRFCSFCGPREADRNLPLLSDPGNPCCLLFFFCTMTRRPLEVYRHSIWYRKRTNECEVKQRWSAPNKNRLNNKMVHLIGILHEGYFFVAALLGTSFYPNLLIKTKPLYGFLIS